MENKKYVGIVCWFNISKGFGFLTWNDENGVAQKDAFVHYSDVVSPGFKTLKKDDKVSFSIGTNKRGEPKAIEVTVL